MSDIEDDGVRIRGPRSSETNDTAVFLSHLMTCMLGVYQCISFLFGLLAHFEKTFEGDDGDRVLGDCVCPW